MSNPTFVNKEILFAIILICFALFGCGPTEEELRKRAEENQRLEQEQIAIQVAENGRLENIVTFKAQAVSLYNVGQYSQAIIKIDSGLSIANQNEEFTLLDLKAEYLLKDKKFIEAVSIFNLLIENDPEVNYLKRAICFEKLHKRQEVVNDLKKAIALGNEEASLLYDKINPIKKKIAYYVTRCCDGSTSNAKGRGACSHHDGVCNWNDPVYTEYRDY